MDRGPRERGAEHEENGRGGAGRLKNPDERLRAVYSTHPDKEPSDAQKSVKVWDACEFRGRKLKAAFWDGVTDFSRKAKEAEESAEGGEEKRIDAFGDWLEDQGELPPELQLRVEE